MDAQSRKHSTTEQGKCDYCGQQWSERVQPVVVGRQRGSVCEGCSSGLARFVELADMDGDGYCD